MDVDIFINSQENGLKVKHQFDKAIITIDTWEDLQKLRNCLSHYHFQLCTRRKETKINGMKERYTERIKRIDKLYVPINGFWADFSTRNEKQE